jgi:hypothetical protein
MLWNMFPLLARVNYRLFPFQIHADQNVTIDLVLEGKGFAHFQVFPYLPAGLLSSAA